MKIVISDPLDSTAVKQLKQLGNVEYQPKDLDAALKDADVLMVRSATKVTADIIAHAPQLKIVARAGVGLDNIDVAACVKRNIKIINTPGASANAVAELTIACILNLLRHIPKAHLQMKNKVWAKKQLTGQELEGKTLGLIGFGRIGGLVAKKALALGMQVIAHDPKPKEMKGVQFVSLDKLFATSDIVSLHAALNEKTKNMINANTLAKMNGSAYLVNIARGELVDEDALYNACKQGKLAGAALDVYTEEPYKGKLLELDNVYFTPHIGAGTKEAQARIGQELIEKLKQELK